MRRGVAAGLVALAISGAIGASVVAAPAAIAHPLGNFTVNRYAGVAVSAQEVRVDYVLDLAEVPTFQALDAIDVDGDDLTNDAELGTWAAARADDLAERVVVEVNGERVPLVASGASAALAPGQAGLQVLRLEATLAGRHDADGGTVLVRDGNDPGTIGWREITVAGAGGFAVVDASVPTASVSDRLRAYPDDLLSSPLDVSEARGTFGPGSGAGTVVAGGERGSAVPRTDPLAAALAHGGPLVVLGLLLAFALGAWHAILPGHGKTLMAAAMIGSGARTRQAASMAVAVALMHSASVLALGLAVLALGTTFRPETLYPWLGVVSGGAALVVGLHLLRGRMRGWRDARAHAHGDAQDPHGHERHHAPGHDHGDGGDVSRLLSPRGLGAIAMAGGILPAPSALLVLLAAIQVHRAAYGVALVVAFSLGLAGALLAIGIGAVRVRGAVLERASSRLATALALASAAAITVVGAFLTVRAVGSF